MAGGKKNKKNNSYYENLKPNLMECVIRIFMNFVLLFCDYVVSFDLNVPQQLISTSLLRKEMESTDCELIQ